MDIVKKIMIAKDTLNSVVRAKTGWGDQDNQNIGWYVGYVETSNNVYYFANCIQSSSDDNQDFAKARIEILYQILTEMKILNQESEN
jgi:beta-lactamase class D